MNFWRRSPAPCVLLVLVAVLATVPVLEMGLNDDWSFAFIALRLARTGHIVYNGWAAPLLGFQAWWGAWLIRVFGLSFTLLRLSTLPFAAGCAWLLYRLGRSAGLNHGMAVFGSLALVLSPVFIPLAASFMTDVPGLFFWLACFYFAFHALDASRARVCIGWMAAAAVAGFMGGTIRQVVWVAPFLALAVVAWQRRRRRQIPLAAGILCAALAAAAAACLNWYQAQPGHEPLGAEPWAAVVRDLPEPFRLLLLATLLALFPVLALAFSRWRGWRRAPLAPLAGTLAAAGFMAVCLWGFQDYFLLGNMVTPAGILWEDSEALGAKPQVLADPVLVAFGVLACLAAGFSMAWLFTAWRRRSGWLDQASSVRHLLLLTAPSCAIYLAGLAYRYTGNPILFDRYLIFVTPPLIISLLWLFQRLVRPEPAPYAWLILAIFGLYGVASTHDYIAAARARLAAADRVTASGVPRTQVSAGLEYDGWTQLQCTGRIPSRGERQRDQRVLPTDEPYWFWRMTPSVTPRYVIVYAPVDGLRDSSFGPVSYRAWLPPFQRQVLTQQAPEPLPPSAGICPAYR